MISVKTTSVENPDGWVTEYHQPEKFGIKYSTAEEFGGKLIRAHNRTEALKAAKDPTYQPKIRRFVSAWETSNFKGHGPQEKR